jgi:predicted dehydrogenase
MKEHRIGIIMNGVTGRMGSNQHLMRAIAAIRNEGGLAIRPGEVILPEPVLIGRNPDKLAALSRQSGEATIATDLDTYLDNDAYPVYFDAQVTGLRAPALQRAIQAGKHVYCEKPTATDTETAMALYQACRDNGLKHGVVQDKLWLPGLIKLRRLVENGFFGNILSVQIEFGYWIFEGHTIPAQRPSWNYRGETHGGIILDMMPHIRCILDNLIAPVRQVFCHMATHIPERIDENGQRYRCDVEDAAYLLFQLENDISGRVTCSWTERVHREDLLTVKVDGTLGSAQAGLHACHLQHYGQTPRPVWDPERASAGSYRDQWGRVPDQEDYPNPFRAQWAQFLRHVVLNEPFPWNLREGAKGVQLAEAAMLSSKLGKWVAVEELEV